MLIQASAEVIRILDAMESDGTVPDRYCIKLLYVFFLSPYMYADERNCKTLLVP